MIREIRGAGVGRSGWKTRKGGGDEEGGQGERSRKREEGED